MADYIINESGMDFIANTDDTYPIEKSQALATAGSTVCIQIKSVLKSMLNPYLKIWKADLSVLNLTAAKKYNLIN